MGFYTKWLVERPIDGKWVKVHEGCEKVGYGIIELFTKEPIDSILRNSLRQKITDSTEKGLGELEFLMYVTGPYLLNYAQSLWLMVLPPVIRCPDLLEGIRRMVEAKGDRLIIWGDS